MNRSLILIAAFLCFLGMSSAQSIQDGLKQMENENYTAALQTFSGLAKSDPKNPINQYYIGEVHYALENTTEARKAYEKGLSINSNCDQCHIGLGRLDFDSGKFDEGQKHLDLALKGNSKNAQIQALVGGAYLYGKSPRPDLALPYLEKARDLDPKQAKFWIALGDAYQLKGELGDAMTAYETAVEKDKTDLETYVKMSRIWADGKQLDLAIERLEKAIEIKSDYALAYKNLYELYIRTRRFDKVVPVLDKYVALSGSDVDAKVRLVKFLSFQAKDYERAIAEGKVLVKAHPEEYTLHRWLAWSYYETGAFDSSLSESYALFGKINQDTSTRKLYASDVEYAAKAAIKLNLADTADQFYLKLIAMEPERAGEISAQVAKAFYDAKKFDRAEQWYARKMEYTPLTLNEMVYLGTAQKIQNKLVEADTTYAKILSLSPKYDYGWFIRARINNDLDTTKKLFLAKPFFEKYLELASADPIKNKDRLIEANLYMVYYYAQTSEIELAKSYCNMVLNLEPNHEVANEYLKILSGQNRK